jgi:hypothetical protein
MRADAARRMREMAGWTMLGMVVTASRIAIWLDDVTVFDGTAVAAGTADPADRRR